MTDPALIVRNFTLEPVPDVYKHYKGSLHRVLFVAEAKEVTDPPERVVTYVSLATGRIFTRPVTSETLDAWTDGIQIEPEIVVPRYENVGVQEPPEPPPSLQPIDIIRICRQLQLTQTPPPLNPFWYYDIRLRVIEMLRNLNTPASLAGAQQLVAADPDAQGEFLDEAMHQIIYGTIADALILESGISGVGVDLPAPPEEPEEPPPEEP
jgi:hypothetical protein